MRRPKKIAKTEFLSPSFLPRTRPPQGAGSASGVKITNNVHTLTHPCREVSVVSFRVFFLLRTNLRRVAKFRENMCRDGGKTCLEKNSTQNIMVVPLLHRGTNIKMTMGMTQHCGAQSSQLARGHNGPGRK